jgi:hypothetical protein
VGRRRHEIIIIEDWRISSSFHHLRQVYDRLIRGCIAERMCRRNSYPGRLESKRVVNLSHQRDLNMHDVMLMPPDKRDSFTQ